MTTIPGHNIVIQQSGRAHDATHNFKSVQPDPAHLQARQEVQETAQQTTVQSLENQGKLDADVTPEERERKKRKKIAKKKKKSLKIKREQSPEAPGNLLDTVA